MLITTSNSLRRWHRIRGWVLDLQSLQQHMELKALNPECLSRRLGAGKNTVRDWFQEGHQPSMHNYLRLCEELGVQP